MTIKHTQLSWRTSGVHKPESSEKATIQACSLEKNPAGKGCWHCGRARLPKPGVQHGARRSSISGKGLEPSSSPGWKTNPAPQQRQPPSELGKHFPHGTRSGARGKQTSGAAGRARPPPAGLYGSRGRVLEPAGSAQRGGGGSVLSPAQHRPAREQRRDRRGRATGPGAVPAPQSSGGSGGWSGDGSGMVPSSTGRGSPARRRPRPAAPAPGSPRGSPRPGTGAHLRCRPSSR